MRLLGIDALASAPGPTIVDVNEFPNYTGVEEASAVIGALLAAATERLAGGQRRRAAR